MTLLVLGIFLFFDAHLFSKFKAVRAQAIASVGEGAYKLLYSAAAGIGLLLMIVGYRAAGETPVYTPLDAESARSLAHALMPFSMILVLGANIPSNLKRYVRHPMSTGVLIWAGVHLASNGDLASLLLFGAFALYALLDIGLSGPRLSAPPVKPRVRDLVLVAAGLVAYGAALYVHGLLGYPVVG